MSVADTVRAWDCFFMLLFVHLLNYAELEFVKQKQVKIGHGGTLDRTATGVLPVGLGTGCISLKEFLHSDKVSANYSIYSG